MDESSKENICFPQIYKLGKRKINCLKISGKFYLFLFILSFFFCIHFESLCQTIDSSRNQHISFQKDSLNVSGKQKKKFEMQKSTWTALACSIIPGGGQVYVGSYWKAPLFFGGACTLVYYIFYNNNQYNSYTKRWVDIGGASNTSVESYNLQAYKEYYHDMRDLSAFYLLGVYLLSSIDAYVGAHLYDFNVNEDISLKIVPINPRGVGLQLSLKY